MLIKALDTLTSRRPASVVDAHCDGPCGIYDPASARVAAEASLSMTKKILALETPAAGDSESWARYINTLSRYVAIKEEETHVAKEELLVLWTDYFKPPHLEAHPELHDIFWKAAKLCSAVKVEVNLEHAQELLASVEAIHHIFWATKGRDVPWITAG
jgi:nickel superoxide dismutase